MASGDALLSWTARGIEPPDDLIAALASLLTASTDEPDDVVPLADFDPTTQEYSSFAGVMPSHYGGGGVTLKLFWFSAATTGNVKWDAAFKSFTAGVDNINTKVYAAIQTSTDATDGTAGVFTESDITFTDGGQMDSVAANEYFRLSVSRDSADGADTMNSNDARLVAAYLTET
jgi:hypothetical protein